MNNRVRSPVNKAAACHRVARHYHDQLVISHPAFRVRSRAPLATIVIAAAATFAACKPEPPQDFVVDGQPVSVWIAASINPDNFNGQRRAWQVLRKAGGKSVAPLRRAMEQETDPERRARIGLAFGFLCASALPAMREAGHEASGDVQTRIKLAGDFIASQDSMRRASNPADSVEPGC